MSTFKNPGEHSLLIPGKAGKLETIITAPDKSDGDYLALLGHPHSLHGGTMHNKVVTTMVRAFIGLGIPCLRFNFRGVGQSEGEFDEGIGESEDMLALREFCYESKLAKQFFYVGFSFGSYVAYRAAGQDSENQLLITIAPPVHHYNYKAFTPHYWHIIQPAMDEITPLTLVEDFVCEYNPPLPLHIFPDSSHFFHGKLLQLKDTISGIVQARISSL